MGDRTWAYVEIREEYYPILEAFLKKKNIELGDLVDEIEPLGDTVQLIQYEANYGNIEDITVPLEELHVSYNHGWESGSGYSAGTRYLRFDADGVGHEKEIYDNYDGLIGIGTVLRELKNCTTVDDVQEFLNEQMKEFEVVGGRDISAIPIRPLTEEEAAIIMQFKMEKEK